MQYRLTNIFSLIWPHSLLYISDWDSAGLAQNWCSFAILLLVCHCFLPRLCLHFLIASCLCQKWKWAKNEDSALFDYSHLMNVQTLIVLWLNYIFYSIMTWTPELNWSWQNWFTQACKYYSQCKPPQREFPHLSDSYSAYSNQATRHAHLANGTLFILSDIIHWCYV